jgi:hypothetical protein
MSTPVFATDTSSCVVIASSSCVVIAINNTYSDTYDTFTYTSPYTYIIDTYITATYTTTEYDTYTTDTYVTDTYTTDISRTSTNETFVVHDVQYKL